MRADDAARSAEYDFLHRTETRIGVVVVLVLGTAWAFIELAEFWSEGGAHRLDRRILGWFRDGPRFEDFAGPWWLETVVRDLTALGGVTLVVLFSLATVVFLLLARRWGQAAIVSAATIGGALLQQVLKGLYERPRPGQLGPEAAAHLGEVSSFSFPSGHTTMAAVVYLTLGLLIARLVTSHILKLYIFMTALFLAFLVGVTRVALGVHYPTDVLAGWTVGLSWALVSWFVADLIDRLRNHAPPTEGRGDDDPLSADALDVVERPA